ncbi:MAG: hypothetical protein WBA55_08150 [Allopontixanthobacter sediminis]
MNAFQTNFHKPGSGSTESVPARRGSANTMSLQWTALQDAAAAVAMLAGLPLQTPSRQTRNFPAQIKEIGGWKLELARHGVTDLTAIMQPGLTALLAVNARGQDASVPAMALWQEFEHARDALLELAPDSSAHGPRRSA